jgi:hypothetical protein
MYDTQRADLDALAANVSQGAMRWHAEDLSSRPALKITALERRWHFYERQLDSWRREQQRLVDEYADEATQVESRRESWNATLAPENQLGSALALKTRVDEVLAALTAADRAQQTDEPAARTRPARQRRAVDDRRRAQGGRCRGREL